MNSLRFVAATSVVLVVALLPVGSTATSGQPVASVVTNGALVMNGPIVGPGSRLRVGPWFPDDRPGVSPDGSALVYPNVVVREGPDDVSLRVLPSGGNPREIWSNVGLALHQPAWSPDGSQVAVATMPFGRLGGPAKVWLVDAEGGSEPTLLLDGRTGEFTRLAWSPDGASLYYTRYSRDLFRYDLQHGTFHQLTEECSWAKVESPGPLGDCESPDGRAFLSVSPDGQHLAATLGRRVEVLDSSDGSVVRVLVALTRRELPTGVAWSPDGESVAYTRYTPHRGSSVTEVVPADGGTARVVGDSAVAVWQPCPNGACPVLGEPRQDAKVSVSSSVRGDEVRLSGRVRPRPAFADPRMTIGVVLQKRRRGRWGTVSRRTASLDSDYRFATAFSRPTASSCRVVVRYAGGWYLTAARTKRRFAC